MLRAIELFVFWYPAIMSVFWMVGAVIFYISNERKKPLPFMKRLWFLSWYLAIMKKKP